MVSVGIIVSIMLISGVDVAANSMAKYMTVQVLDEIKIDYDVRSDEENYTLVVDTLNQLNQSDKGFDSYIKAFATAGADWQNTYITPSTEAINWSKYTIPQTIQVK